MNDQSPVNALPPLVLAVFVAIAAIEAVLSLGAMGAIGGPAAVGWRIGLIERVAVSPRVLQLVSYGDWSPQLLLRFVAYPFVHASFTHTAFAAAIWLALGKFVGDLYRPWAVAAIALMSTITGAVVFALVGLALGINNPLFGAYPAVYGLIGAYTYLMWLQLGHIGENRLQAFRMIGVLLGLQLAFAMLFGADPTWSADLSGFAAGGLTAILVAPGGWRRFVERLRQR